MIRIFHCLLLFELVLYYQALTNAEYRINKIHGQSLLTSATTSKANSKSNLNKFVKTLFNADDLGDLASFGVVVEPKKSSIVNRVPFGRSGEIPKALTTEDSKDATPGKCDPKPVCISNPLTLNIRSSQFAFPPCINIHRCDGCCPTNEKCVPIKTHDVRLSKVGIINFDGENLPKYEETIVTVQNHTDCQCQCQWQSDKDCQVINANYVLNPQACECVCPEEFTCDALHEFDREECKCKCKENIFGKLEQNCKFRGLKWNHSICKCEANKKNNY